MKKIMLASAIAFMCLSSNAFAEDDGYGNDIPPARTEGTVDDGYGNKLPANNEPEYKSYEDARASSGSSASTDAPVFNIGFHLGFGFGNLLSYPSYPLYTEYMGKKEDWTNYSFDVGGIFKYRVNNLLMVVPEVNLGFGIMTRETESGRDWFFGDYKVSENRAFINVNVPVMARFTPIKYLYLEAGARLNFNFTTVHTQDITDKDGNPYEVCFAGECKKLSDELEEWKVSSFIPSAVAGIGASFKYKNREFDVGIRFTWDLTGLEKDDKVDFFDPSEGKYLEDENGEKIVLKNNTKWMSFQFVLNYYLF
ncbi:MAG: PorT family protein [Fibrobacter sp.]|uniref:porin family protein n=1 Tax=Fibrobacter sp. TaxID=35828 RepID=UPI0025BB2799|nr:porin family protein [Fibrobacter sp.]MBQ7081224.1 PorT family protein [Fibrobacter sp.]